MDFMKEICVQPYIAGTGVRFVQEKLNGYCVEIYRGFGNDIKAYTKSRQTNIWTQLAQVKAINTLIIDLPHNTALKGELWAEGVPASSITTLIKNSDQRLIFSPFEMPVYGGLTAENWTIEEVNKKLCDFRLPKTIRLADDNKPAVKLNDDKIDNWLCKAIDANIEGWVLKDRHCGNYYKLKPEKTIDAVITGFAVCDKGQFAGGIKSLQASVYKDGKEFVIADIGSGIDKDLRMIGNPQSLIGRIIEVKYQDIAAKGRLQFPVFMRFRDDEKAANQCTYDQLAA